MSRDAGGMCFDCLRQSLENKVKTAFKHLGIGRNSAMVVAYSGGAASTLLLHVLWGCIFGPRSRTGYKVHVVYVDSEAVSDLWDYAMSPEQRAAVLTGMREVVTERFGFPFTTLPLETVFREEGGEPGPCREKLRQLFLSVKSADAKIDLASFLSRMVLRRFAGQAGPTKFDFLLQGDTTSRLAERILFGTALGRGYSLPLELQLADHRDASVVVGLPLRDVLAREAALYCHLAKLPTCFMPSFASSRRVRTNIHGLSASLLNKLQGRFPNTMPTVLRTGLKIALSENVLRTTVSDDLVPPAWPAADVVATEDPAASDLSVPSEKPHKWGGRRRKGDDFKMPLNLSLCPLCSGPLHPRDVVTGQAGPPPAVRDSVCAPCKGILNSSEVVSILPPQVIAAAAQVQTASQRRRAMHAVIADCLIEPEGLP